VHHAPRAIHIHAANRNHAPRNFARSAHQLTRLFSRAQDQVDNYFWRKSLNLLQVIGKAIPIPLDSYHILIEIPVCSPVKDRN
jgi:hypothetical protein